MDKNTRIPILTSVSIFLRDFWRERHHFLGLVKWDFREAYLGTYIGLAWAFLKPILYLAVLSLGLKQGLGMRSPVEGKEFHLWLICGLLPWMYISESLSTPIESIVRNSFLVKKLRFNASFIPLSKVATALLIHLFLTGLFLVYLVVSGERPGSHWLQLPLLMLCSTVLLGALGLISASVFVFTRDLGQVLNLVTTLAIWVTPVFWSTATLQEPAKGLLSLNPFTFIVEGYRQALLLQASVFEDPRPFFGYLAVTLPLLTASMLIFRRLNNHFADVI